MKLLRLILAAMASVAVLAGFLVAFYHWGISVERNKWVGKFYPSDVEIHDVVSSDLAPSIDFSKQAKTIVSDAVQLVPYTIHWYQVQYDSGVSSWRAYLYVPVGTGEAVKHKLETLDFVDGVVIRNSTLYEYPKDDRLEVELSQRANKSHTERLDAILPGIVNAAERGL